MRRHRPVPRVGGDVVAPDDRGPVERRREHRRRSRVPEVLERLTRRARQRVQRVLPAVAVGHVVEERAELRPGQSSCRVGDGLDNTLHIQLRRQHARDVVQRLDETRLLAARFLGLLLVRDVIERAHPLTNVAMVIEHRHAAGTLPAIAAVRQAQAILVLIDAPRLERAPPRRRAPRSVIRMQRIQPTRPANLVLRLAGQRPPVRHVFDHSMRVGVPHELRTRLHQRAVAILAPLRLDACPVQMLVRLFEFLRQRLRLVHLLFQLRRALQKVSFGARNPHSTANRLRETVGDDGVVRNDVMRPCTLELGRVP